MSIYLQTEYVTTSCGPSDSGGCGLPFAMTRDFYDEMNRTGRRWYCPNGHPRVYGGKTTEQELDAAKAREQSLNDQLGAAIRDAEAARVALLRDRQRFANGLCPCCNRSFDNVRRHMESKHPDYDAKAVKAPAAYRCSCRRSFDTFKGLRTHQGWARHDGWDKPNTPTYRAHLTRT